MKCSHSSTLVPNVARLVGLRSWKGSFKKKPHIAVNVSKRELNTHRAFTVGVRLECMRRRKPKRCGVRGNRPIREGKKGRRPSRKIIIDFILIDTDYPPIGYAIQRRRRWEMKREWKKSVKNRKEYIWKYIVKTYDKIRKIYVKWESPSWDTLYYFYPNYCSILTWNSQIPPKYQMWVSITTVPLNAIKQYIHTHTQTYYSKRVKNVILTRPEGMSWLEKWSKASG